LQIAGEYIFDAGREEVWRTLNNPDALRATLPGCREFKQVGQGSYRASLVLGFAFIKASYKGEISMTDVQEPESYVLSVHGSGPLGGAKGRGLFKLETIERTGQTRVRYSGQVAVTGKVAAFGETVIQAGANIAISRFFASMEREVARAASKERERTRAARYAAG
jgi:uncharacterized protein